MQKSSRLKKSFHYKCNSWKVPGWFPLLDFNLFEELDLIQDQNSITGDILEIGTYKGKSGVLLSILSKPKQMVNLLDLYLTADSSSNLDSEHYSQLTGSEVEKYLKKFGRPAKLIIDNSKNVKKHILPQTQRLIHIDGSHLYEDALLDLNNCHELQAQDGVTILDDYRNFAFPGVGKAFWEYFSKNENKILFATPTKIYFCKASSFSIYSSGIQNLNSKKYVIKEIELGSEKVQLITFQTLWMLWQKLYSLLSLAVLLRGKIFRILKVNK